jgi:hypothetical protein
MDSELIEGKSGEAYQRRVVRVETRLIADVDTHIRASNSAGMIPAIT